MTAGEAARFLRAFGDGTRLRILALLSIRSLSVSDLVTTLGRPQPNISRHLRYLHARGLVEAESVGNSVVYRLALPRGPLHQDIVSSLFRHLDELDGIRGDRAALKQRPGGRQPR